MGQAHHPPQSGLRAAFLLTTATLTTALSFPSIPTHPLAPRSSTNTTSTALSIPPSQYWDGNDGPWSSFPFQIGTGSTSGLQNVRLLISTAATATWTIGAEGCPNGYITNCPSSRGGLFLRNQSLTWTPDSIYQTGLEVNLGLDSSGYVGYDTVTMGWQGSGVVLTETHQTIWNIADPNYWVGIFGLNPRPTNLTNFNNPLTSYMEGLYQNGQIPSVSYGYTAGNQYRLNQVYGSLTLGGYDANRFVSNDVTFGFYQDISRDLSVNLQAISTSKGSPSNLLPDGSISIFIDSTVPEIWLPESACAAFESAFGITYDNNTGGGANDEAGRYIISDSLRQQLIAQDASVTFTIGPNINGGKTVDITLPYAAFDLQLGFPIISKNSTGTTYYFPLQRAANSTQYTLGRTFLQEAYITVDYERQNFSVSQCDWSQKATTQQNLINILSPNSQNGPTSSGGGMLLSTGAIAGVAIGAVALIAILCIILFLLHRKKKSQKRKAAERAAKESNVDPNASDAAFAKFSPNPDTSGAGELGGSDIYEAPPNQRAHEMESGRDDGRGKFGYSEMDGKGYVAEMPGNAAVYEMQGSDVYEMGSGRRSKGPEWI